MTPVFIVGGGGHCKSCIDVIESTNEYKILGIFDNRLARHSLVCGYPVLGGDGDWNLDKSLYQAAVIGVGQIRQPNSRILLHRRLIAEGISCPSIVSDHAVISQHAKIGSGTIIMHGAVVNAGATIGDNVIINTGSIVEHDAFVGSNSHISTGVILNGGVVVGSNSFVGSNTIVKELVKIPECSFLKAGSVILADVNNN